MHPTLETACYHGQFAHRAPDPEPVEDPLPEPHPIPEKDPVPDHNPE